MSVNDFVTFTIQVTNTGVSQLGFGTGMYVSYTAAWAERMRSYGQYADVLADFAVGTPEALAANAYFNQSPHPIAFKIGRGTLKPTKQYAIGAIQVNNTYVYSIQVDGPGITSTLATFTSDGSATLQEIHNGLVAALNAVVGKNYTATFAPLASLAGGVVTANAGTDALNKVAHGWNTGDGPIQFTNAGGGLPAGIVALTDYYVIKVDADNFKIATSLALALAGTQVDITTTGTGVQTATPTAGALSPILPFLTTGTAAGNWFSLFCSGDSSVLSNKETSADAGIATDLAQLAVADPDWYCFLSGWNSKAIALQYAAWVEGNNRITFAFVCDSDAVNTGLGNLDTLDALNSLGYKRTDGKYHPNPLCFFGAASAGAILALNPGKWTEAFKANTGVPAVKLTSTQAANLRLRRAGTITTEKGRTFTWDGKVFSPTYGYLDIVVGLDWFADQVQSAALGVLVSLAKVSYTDEDIDMIAGAIRGVIADAVSDAHKLLDPGDPNDPTNPPPAITFPKVSTISSSTRAIRKLPNGVINGRLQGAVQGVDFLATVTF